MTMNVFNQQLRRQVVWDVSPCTQAEEILRRCGATPASEEILEHEHAMSHHRLNRVMLIDPYIQLVSRMAAEAICHSRLESEESSAPVDMTEFAEEVQQEFAAYLTASRAVIAGLLEEGVLVLRGRE